MATDVGHEIACRWFVEYLGGLDLPFERDPHDLGVATTPDFLVQSPGGPLVCEMKTFEHHPGLWAFTDDQTVLVRDVGDTLKPIRDKIRSAAKQLKPLRDRGMSLIVVMADPLGTQVPLDMTLSAMLGDLRAVLSTTQDGQTEKMLMPGRNGKLREDHSYISAVMTLRAGATSAAVQVPPEHGIGLTPRRSYTAIDHTRTSEDVGYFATTLVESISATCVAVPEGVFVGPYDIRVRVSADRSTVTSGVARL